MSQTQQINPRVLAWARETAGFTVEEAAEKLALGNTERVSAAEKLFALEAGQKAPTYSQLLKAASVYKRPLIAFYMANPPREEERSEDFRTVGAAVSRREAGLLEALIRDVKARQQIVRSMLEDEDEAVRLPFVSSASIKQTTSLVSNAIRTTLAITEADQRTAKGPDRLFALLRSAAERIGVFVLLLGDMGSPQSAISEQVFRGFAIADDVAPFVVINDRDARTARSFTLIHELAHLWIGAGGVSGPVSQASTNSIERFCNDVAGEFLLPSQALESRFDLSDADAETVLQATQHLAQEWNVSQALVTYRFARKRWISDAAAGEVFALLATRWRREREKSREDQADAGGPSYYVVRRSRLGTALLNVVRRGLQSDALTHTRAAKVLGVNPVSVGPLLLGPKRAA